MNFLFIGCRSQLIVENETGDKNCKKRVLIATLKSEFKDAVVSMVLEALDEDLCYIKLINLKTLASEKVKNYEVIIIMNSRIAWQLNRHVINFLQKHTG